LQRVLTKAFNANARASALTAPIYTYCHDILIFSDQPSP
jgi:hypothetical protein